MKVRRMFEMDFRQEMWKRRSFLLVPLDVAGDVNPKGTWHLVASPYPYVKALPLKKGESERDTLYELLVEKRASWKGDLRTKITESTEPLIENIEEGVVLFHRHGVISSKTAEFLKPAIHPTFALLPEGFYIERFLEELKSEAERFQALRIISSLNCKLGGVLFPTPKVSDGFLNWVRESKELAFILRKYQKLLRRTMGLKWEYESGHWNQKSEDRCENLKGSAQQLSRQALIMLLVVGDDFHFAEALRCIETDCNNIAASVLLRSRIKSIARGLGEECDDIPPAPESEPVKIELTPERLALNQAVEIRYNSVLLATKPSGGWIGLDDGGIRNFAHEWFENTATGLGHRDATALYQSPQWLSPY